MQETPARNEAGIEEEDGGMEISGLQHQPAAYGDRRGRDTYTRRDGRLSPAVQALYQSFYLGQVDEKQKDDGKRNI